MKIGSSKFTSFFILSGFITLLSPFAWASTSELCKGLNQSLQLSFSPLIQSRNSDQLVLIDWNAHKLEDKQFIQDLSTLAQTADIITIQEAMHSKDFQNDFLNLFPFSFSFHKSFCNRQLEATGVLNISRYLLENNKTLVAPDTEPLLNTPKVSGYSTVLIPEIGRIHIINTHALNFNFGYEFRRQIDSVAKFIESLEGPVIWAGDFNTWNESRKAYLLKRTSKLGLKLLVPPVDNRSLKLDHVFVRGLKAKSVEVLYQYTSSDHLPLKVILEKTKELRAAAL